MAGPSKHSSRLWRGAPLRDRASARCHAQPRATPPTVRRGTNGTRRSSSHRAGGSVGPGGTTYMSRGRGARWHRAENGSSRRLCVPIERAAPAGVGPCGTTRRRAAERVQPEHGRARRRADGGSWRSRWRVRCVGSWRVRPDDRRRRPWRERAGSARADRGSWCTWCGRRGRCDARPGGTCCRWRSERRRAVRDRWCRQCAWPSRDLGLRDSARSRCCRLLDGAAGSGGSSRSRCGRRWCARACARRGGSWRTAWVPPRLL